MSKIAIQDVGVAEGCEQDAGRVCMEILEVHTFNRRSDAVCMHHEVQLDNGTI